MFVWDYPLEALCGFVKAPQANTSPPAVVRASHVSLSKSLLIHHFFTFLVSLPPPFLSSSPHSLRPSSSHFRATSSCHTAVRSGSPFLHKNCPLRANGLYSTLPTPIGSLRTPVPDLLHPTSVSYSTLRPSFYLEILQNRVHGVTVTAVRTSGVTNSPIIFWRTASMGNK